MLNLKKTLTKILELFSNQYTTVSNSATVSTPTGSKSVAVSLTIPQGYEFIGFKSISLSYAECHLYAFGWDGANSRAEVNYRNNYTGTLSVKVTVSAVCAKVVG